MSPQAGGLFSASRSVVFVLLSLCLVLSYYCTVSAKSLAESSSSSNVGARTKRTAASTTTGEPSCEKVKSVLLNLNITLGSPDTNKKGSVCGGGCCGDGTEDLLRQQGQRDFASILRHRSRSVQGQLSFMYDVLENYVSDLSRQSENKTLLLFSQVYKGMAVLSREPINALYSDIRSYIQTNSNRSDWAVPSIDIRASVDRFFSEFFPLVYHHILFNSNANRDFSLDYKTCLKKAIDSVVPFEDIPKDLSHSLARSLEITRLLFQAFKIGIEVLDTTDALLIDESGKNNAECHNALLKMTHCPKCLGLVKHTKPCSGYCLNVLRGCLTKYVAELDSPWNGYVEGVEDLVSAMKKNNGESRVSADLVIRSLESRISEAIMRAMEKGKDIDEKVKRICGQPAFSSREDPLLAEVSTPSPTTTKPRSANSRGLPPLPETQISHFLTSIGRTRGFYANLADTLCQDDNFAEPKDQRCWNGERIAEYTKTVVDVGLDMQKYNPEVKPIVSDLQNVDPRVAVLVDKLRHVHHVAMSTMGSSPSGEVDYMQRDGVEGSGSGDGPGFEDNEDSDNTRGSGSGNGAFPDDDEGRNINHDFEREKDHQSSQDTPSVTTTGGGASFRVSLFTLLFCLFSVAFTRR